MKKILLFIAILHFTAKLNAQFNQKHYDIAPSKYNDAKNERDKLYCIYKWGERLLIEFPDITDNDLRTKYRRLDYKTRMLFYDHYFEQIFGAPFFELSPKLQDELRDSRVKKKKNEGIITWQKHFIRFFNSERKNSKFSIEAQEQHIIWEHLLSELNRSDLTFQEVIDIENQSHVFTYYIWSSEIKKLHDNISLLKMKLSQGAIIAWQDEINKMESTYDNYRKLIGPKYVKLLQSLTDSQKHTYIAITGQIKSKIRKDLIEQYKREIILASKNEEPVRSLNQWYRVYLVNWVVTIENSKLPNLISFYYKELEKCLIKEEEKWTALLINSQTLDLLETNQNQCLVLPSIPVCIRLKEVYEKQKQKLIFETLPVTGIFSASRILELESKTASTGAPSEDQMRLAIVKRLDGINKKSFFELVQAGFQTKTEDRRDLKSYEYTQNAAGDWLGILILASYQQNNSLNSKFKIVTFKKNDCTYNTISNCHTCTYDIQTKAVGGFLANLNESLGIDVVSLPFPVTKISDFVYDTSNGWNMTPKK